MGTRSYTTPNNWVQGSPLPAGGSPSNLCRHFPPATSLFQRYPPLPLLQIGIDQALDHLLDMRIAFVQFAVDGADEAVGDVGLAAAFFPEGSPGTRFEIRSAFTPTDPQSTS